MAQWSTRINQVIFAVLDVIEQWALTVIKLLRFFVLIFAVFLPDFIFFCTTMAQSSKFHENCGCFLYVHPIKLERSLCG